MPKVTICIPAYNQAEYLPDAIESALAQTVQCEVIVINDGSLDKSEEIAKSYPVKVISQVNKGLASARNTGIMNMTGGWFFPLDSDDYIADDCIEKLLKKQKETDADVIAPSVKCFGIGNDTVVLMENPTTADFRVGNRIPYASLIRKSALLECGGYSPRMVEGYEDYHLWFNLLSLGKKFETVPEPLFFYRTKQVSMWKEAKKHHVKLMQQIYKDFPSIWPKELVS